MLTVNNSADSLSIRRSSGDASLTLRGTYGLAVQSMPQKQTSF